MSMRSNYLSESVRRLIEEGGVDNAIIVENVIRPWTYVKAAIEGLEAATTGTQRMGGLSIGIITRNRPPHLALIDATIALGHCYFALNPMFSDQDLANDIVGLGLHVMAASHDALARFAVWEAALRSGAAIIELTSGEAPLKFIRKCASDRDLPDRSGAAI